MMETCMNMTKNGEQQLKHLNNDIIRIGFMMVFEKLENDRVNTFVNESNYLQ